MSHANRAARLHRLLASAAVDDHIFSAAAALRYGFDRSALSRLAADGFVERVGPRHFRPRHVPWTLQARHREAVTLAGPVAQLGARSALVHYGLTAIPPNIEVLVPRGVKGTPGSYRRMQSTDIAPSDIVTRRGIPMSTPVRAVIDAGRDLTISETVQAISLGIERKLITAEKVERRLAELAKRGRPGVRTVRTALSYFDHRPLATTFEQDFEAVVRRNGFAQPLRQLRVKCEAHTYYLDHAWPDHELWVECDSMLAHGSAEALQADNERQNRIISQTGFQPLRFTYWDVHGRPEYVAETLARHLPRQRRTLGSGLRV